MATSTKSLHSNSGLAESDDPVWRNVAKELEAFMADHKWISNSPMAVGNGQMSKADREVMPGEGRKLTHVNQFETVAGDAMSRRHHAEANRALLH